MDYSTDELIEMQYEDTKRLVDGHLIDAWKLCRDRIFTMVVARNPGRKFTWEDVNGWFDANHPEVPSGRSW